MMQKAGYIQRTGCRAIDRDGRIHEVVELHVVGARYAIRLADLAKGMSGRQVVVQVEALVREWNYYLGTTCGLAQVSASGKALNIELFEAGNFTVSLLALRSVMYGRERRASIARIPEQPVSPIWKDRRVNGQQQISALV
ncbi:MAG: hypothetical protein ABR999_07600 [Methanoregula sp.]|jgi:hypothetical protein|uniref:hypothetical protein n=1 Tax=Methanoregula sp. TaxID=2052170 RepID=UPI003D09F544